MHQFGEGHSGHIFDVLRGDDQIKLVLLLGQGQGFEAAGDAGKVGGVGQLQILVFAAQQIIQPAVLFEHVQVIEAGYQQDVADAAAHEVLKALKTGAIAVFHPTGIKVGEHIFERFRHER
ncbi:MAG: hypothetical protein BWY83_02964 [bacterium ADurb.Bin478]|nr:MAG: hypothetical protein BWY83_02964 [bacterium ADurb.Bin478]